MNKKDLLIPSPSVVEKVKQFAELSEVRDVAELFSESSAFPKNIHPRCHYYASLTRIINASDQETTCSAVFLYRDKLYYAAKCLNSNQKETQRNQILEKFREIILNGKETKNKSIFEDQLNNLGETVKSVTIEKDKTYEARIKFLDKKSQPDCCKRLVKEFREGEKLFLTQSLAGEKRKRDDNLPTDNLFENDLTEKLENLKSAIFNLIANKDAVKAKYKRFSSYFETILYVQDYLDLLKDLKKYIQGQESFLEKAWESIEKGKEQGIDTTNSSPSFFHVENKIIQYIYSKEGTVNFQEIFESAQLRTETPLVASKGNCYTCGNTIDLGGKILSKNDNGNLNLESGSMHPSSYLLLSDFEKKDTGNYKDSLIELQKRVDDVVSALERDSVTNIKNGHEFQAISEPSVFG